MLGDSEDDPRGLDGLIDGETDELGLTLDDGDELTDELGDTEGLTELLGLGEAEGESETEELGDTDGLTELEGLRLDEGLWLADCDPDVSAQILISSTYQL